MMKTVQLDNREVKFFKYSKEAQIVCIYNLDHSKRGRVLVPLPEGYLRDEIIFISQTTINKDPMVEMIYSRVEYQGTGQQENPVSGEFNIRFSLKIINEKGEMILKVPDSNEMEILNTKGKNKLLEYKHIRRGMDDSGQTLVYSLAEK